MIRIRKSGWAAWLAMGMALFAGNGVAATVTLATAPLANSTTSVVRPNLMYVLDNSGSMDQDYTPDYINDSTGTSHSYAMCWGTSSGTILDTNQAAQCSSYSDMPWSTSDINYQYYNPASLYTPPVNADGTSYPASTPTAALNDGYDSSSGSKNLKTGWQHKVWCRNSSDAPTAANPTYGGNCAENSDTSNNNLLPSSNNPYSKTFNSTPYYYLMSPFEYCTDSNLTTCTPSTTSTVIGGVSYSVPSLYRWCASYSTTSHTFSGCQDGRDRTHFIPNYLGGWVPSIVAVKASANLKVNSVATGLKLTSLTINGSNVLSGSTTITVGSSDTTTTIAQAICTAIHANTAASGYDCPTAPSTATLVVTANTAGSAPNGYPVVVVGPAGVTAINSLGSLTVADATSGKTITQITIHGNSLLSAAVTATGSISSTAAAICNAIKTGPGSGIYTVRSGSTTWGNCTGSSSGLVEIQRILADTVDNGQAVLVTGPAPSSGTYSTGTITINSTAGATQINDVTVNGSSILTGSKPISFANGTLTTSIATTIAGQIGNGFTATSIGNVITITSTAVGTANNGPIVVSAGSSAVGATATLNISSATNNTFSVTVKAGTNSSCSTSTVTLDSIASFSPSSSSNPGNSCSACSSNNCKRAVNVANAIYIAHTGTATAVSNWSDSLNNCVSDGSGGTLTYTAPVGTTYNSYYLCAAVTGTTLTTAVTTFSGGSAAVTAQSVSTSGNTAGGTNASLGTIGVTTVNMSNGAAFAGTIDTTATSPATLSMSGGIDAMSAGRSGVGIFKRTDIVPFLADGVTAKTFPKGGNRTDCTPASATTCTYTQELQNFANWYTYYSTRIMMMKTTSTLAFSALQGKDYRVGFDRLTNSGSSSVITPVAQFIDNGEVTNQRTNWWSALTTTTASSATPLRAQTAKIGRYFAGKLSTDPVLYSCQQNFMLLVTDGYWNEDDSTAIKGIDGVEIGNVDNSLTTSPRPYYDGAMASTSCPSNGARSGSSSCRTLADVTRYYYSTDLRDATLWNNAINTSNSQNVSDNNVPTTSADSNTQQHMVFFALGLGVSGTLQFRSDYATAGVGDYASILAGTLNWPAVANNDPTGVDDLWHATVNAHGKYFSARDPSSVTAGLATALSNIQARVGAASAAATSNLQPVPGDNFAYVASYETIDWVGDLQSRTIDLTTGGVSSDTNCGATGSGCTWSAQVQLDAQTWSARNIYVKPTSGATGSALRAFTYTNLTATEQDYFNPSTLSQYASANTSYPTQVTAANLINFLRGDRSMEANGGSQPQVWRNRAHVFGDIINSQPVFVRAPAFNYLEASNPGYTSYKNGAAGSRQPVVYVSANDGMLHAINATTGVEMWSFIPTSALPTIKTLADTSYTHQFFVDGPTTVGDVDFGSGNWHTILVSGLGGGGKEYFALDITDPANPKYLWEFTATNLGYTFGNPSINKLPGGGWAVLFTSGYNNTAGSGDGIGYLYALNPSSGTLISGYPLANGSGSSSSPSNLGKISAWVDDLASDNTATHVYAGDLNGDVWRFDLTARTTFKLAHLANGSGQAQPVSTRPELALAGSTRVIYVGTGEYLGIPDLTNTQVQSLYAIKDTLGVANLGGSSQATWDPRTDNATIGGVPSSPLFLQRKLIQTYNAGTTPITDANGNSIRKVCAGASSQFSLTSNTCINETGAMMDWSTYGGWFVDFPDSGERMNVDMNLTLGTLTVPTNVPASNACTAGGYSWLNYLDYKTGLAVANTIGVAGIKVANALIVGINVVKLPSGSIVAIVTTSDYQHQSAVPPVVPEVFQGKRSLWREFEVY